MVVVFDATMLLLLMHPDTVNPSIDSKTGLPVQSVESRINALIKRLEKEKVKIIIPTPALSELLVHAGGITNALVDRLDKNKVFRFEPFDKKAAIEVAIMAHGDRSGDKSSGVDPSTLRRSKLKYDRQIVAIAKVNNATAIYSDDEHIHRLAERHHIEAIRLEDLPIPAEQIRMELPEMQTEVNTITDEEGYEAAETFPEE